MTPGEITKRFDALRSQRKTAEQTWQWIERYVVPFRGKFFRPQQSEHEIEWNQRVIFDSTAIDAAQTLASSLHGAVTNPSHRWFDIVLRSGSFLRDRAIAIWLEECSEICWQSLKDSNFELEINEHYLDLVGYGTGFLTEDEEKDADGRFKGLVFSAVPLREAFFEQDSMFGPYRFYRLHQWLPAQFIDRFGRENVPQWIIDKDKSGGDLDTKIDLVFCVYEVPGNMGADVTETLGEGKRPFRSKYVIHSTSEQIGEEQTYYEMPTFVTRWLKVSGSMWGHSPSHVMLPTILQLNQVLEIFTVAAEKALDPPLASEQRNIVGDLKLGAAELTVVRDIEKIKPMTPDSRMDMVQFEIESLRQMIRSGYHLDQLELKESPAMTATEVMARVELMNRLLGPTMGRLQSDLFDPLIKRTFRVLYRAKELPPAPEQVTNLNKELDIEYRGPLARSQKTDEAAQLDALINGVVQLAQVSPEILDTIDFDAYVRASAAYRQVPPEVIRPEEEVAERKESRQQQQRMMAGGEIVEQAGKAGKAVGEARQALQPSPVEEVAA